MIQIILTPEQQRLIDESTQPVQLVDRRGQVLIAAGTFVSQEEIAEALQVAAEFDDLSEAEHGLSNGDLNRIAEQSRNLRPTAPTLIELLSQLHSKQNTTTTAQ